MERYPTHEKIEASRITFQPGDGTRYSFVVVRFSRDVYRVMEINLGNVITVDARYMIHELREEYADIFLANANDYQSVISGYPGLLDVCKLWAKKDVNPYTTLAACIVVAEHFA
jgi:hypothetical protein